MAVTERRHPPLPTGQRSAGGAHRAHGRPVLGGEGRGRLVDPEGRVRPRRRGGAGCRAAGVRRGARRRRRPTCRTPSSARSRTRRASGSPCSSPTARTSSLDGPGFGEFELEWPPRSGRTQSFPEVDRAEWTTTDAARERLVKGQRAALDALESTCGGGRLTCSLPAGRGHGGRRRRGGIAARREPRQCPPARRRRRRRA